MRSLREPSPVYFFAAMLAAEDGLFAAAERALAPHLGDVHAETGIQPWDYSSYYEEEMGRGLKRKFTFFARARDPIDIVDVKHRTMDIERELGRREGKTVRRAINIDPGYISPAKLVLSSCKDFSHRVYLGRGVFAEVTLFFMNESFTPLYHTYRDYRDREMIAFFNRTRAFLYRS